MAAATACASTSLAGQALGLSRNALTGKAIVGGARVSMKATATDSTWDDAVPSYLTSEDPGDFIWDTVELPSDPETFTPDRTMTCWQLTMGRLSRSGNIYSYERTNGVAGTLNCWQLTLGRLSRSGNIYSYERTNGFAGTVKSWQLTLGRLSRFGNMYSYERTNGTVQPTMGHLSSSGNIDSYERTEGTVQLTMGRLSWSGNIFSYEGMKDSGHVELKQNDINSANYSYQILEQSEGDKKMHLGTERKPRVLEFNQKMTSKMSTAGTMSEALAVLTNRLEREITVHSDMYIDVLRRCLRQKDLLAAKQVHELINRTGVDKNLYVVTALLNVYIKCGELLAARRVFDELEKKDVVICNMMIAAYSRSGNLDDARLIFNGMEKRNVVTWNTMIGGLAKHGCGHEAHRLLLQMRREGFEPNAITYTSILNASSSTGALDWVKDVHAQARKAGLESDVRLASALVHMYAQSGSMDDARLVFDRMEKRDVVTWNVMIGGLAQHGCGHEAYRLFCQMRREGFEPDAFTYTNILNASGSAGALEWVKEVHGHSSAAGLESDVRVGNALVHMYAQCGSMDDALLVFDRMEKRDVVTWNVMIGGLAKHGCGHEAYTLFLQMRRKGFEPNVATYTNILNASSSAGALEWVKEVHVHASKDGLESDMLVGSALVHMYAKSGSIDDARLVFDIIEKRDVLTWTAMIGGLAEHGCGHEAYQLFLQMRREGFEPNAITYTSILNASASAGSSEWVKEVHSHACKAGLESDVRVGSGLVHMYSKTGSIDDARLVFYRMETRDVVTWNIMIGGLAEHGRGHEALELFRKMIEDGVKPDGTSFVAVLSACCHVGLLDEGHSLFAAMKQDYGIEPDVVHYTCMVDLIGRSGQLEEAKLFISDMPVEPDGVTWRALLGACRTYGHVELGELAANELLKLEPNNASAYVLLSNIYAAAGKWEKVSIVRTLMQQRGVRKEPGRSWIEVDNKIHEFVVGDTSHPEAKEIYTELTKLTEKLKAEGYIPDTQLVLQNIDEEHKELALCSHSEKLAIAYGLMRIPRGKPIRVYKNLRVCSDCHAATKLISKVTGREIKVRDANRFHHFKDGVCSCGDYW